MIKELINSILNIKVVQMTTLFKILFILVLFIMSCIIRDFDFPKKNPGVFIGETLLFAGLPTIMTLISILMRNNKEDLIWKDISKTLGIVFVVFVVINILHQTSGIYEYEFPSGNKNLSTDQIKEKKKKLQDTFNKMKTWGMYGIIGLTFLIMFGIVCNNLWKYRNVDTSLSLWKKGLELVIFVIINSLVVLYTTKMRTGKFDIKSFGVSLAMMLVLYITFQLSATNVLFFDNNPKYKLIDEIYKIDAPLLINELKHMKDVGITAIINEAVKADNFSNLSNALKDKTIISNICKANSTF